MADTNASVDKELEDIRTQIAETDIPTDTSSTEERVAFRKKMDELSKKAAELRKKQIDNDTSLDAKERQILKLYDKGLQNYEIAQKVYDMVNQDSVGRVVLAIRKAHSDDWNQVEDVNSTKGYTGVSR